MVFRYASGLVIILVRDSVPEVSILSQLARTHEQVAAHQDEHLLLTAC